MFANPAFLFALLGAAVPVLIHLIHRRKRTALLYPTLVFLRRVDMKLASRRKLKEWLLLALRAGAVALVALALARPGFTRAGSAGAFSVNTDCVLIVDNSASLGLPAAAGTRLDQARARAAAVLATLGAEDRAALLTPVPAGAEAEVPSFSGDQDRLREALRRLAPTGGAGSLAEALARAKDLLARSSTAPNREIHLFTDLQASGLADAPALASALEGLPPRTTFLLGPVEGRPPAANAALVGVEADRRPKVTGRAMSLAVQVRNPSAREVATSLTVRLEGQPPLSQTLSLEAGESRTLYVPVKLAQEGFLRGEARLEKDDVPYDDVWPFAVAVRGPLRVLVVSPGDAGRPEQDEAFYLCKALDPTGDGRLSGIRVDRVPQRNAPAAGLEVYDAALLCGCDALPGGVPAALERFVRAGGGLMVFAGPRDARLPGPHPLQALLGGEILGERRVAGEEQPLLLRALRPEAPLFDDCRDANGQVEFKDVRILRALKVRAAPGARALAEFSSGDPALLHQECGRGQILWWTVGAQAGDSNLPLQPVFLSLLHRGVAAFLGAESAVLQYKAGSAVRLDLADPAQRAAPAKVTVYAPDGVAHETPLEDGKLVWRGTARIGVYRLEWPGGAPEPAAAAAAAARPRGFAVTPDPSESAPEYLTAEKARAALGGDRVRLVLSDADLAQVLAETRRERDLSGLLFLAALLAVLAEALLANQTGVLAKPKRLSGDAPPPGAPPLPEPPAVRAGEARERVGAGGPRP